ncbi:MAG: hypothetical protein HBSIN02_24810 [Bacteroidia bacterium]|nr:MAG: hypothetical protein HBSIN02_24810 [Bacteroidia bacterium]
MALFLVSTSYPQIIIRERVAIDPKPSVQAQASSVVNAMLRYELQYDGPVRTPELNFMRLQELTCGVFDSGPINSSLTVPAQSGLWNFSFRIHTPIVSNQYARFTVWLGEDVILKDSLLINCGSTCQINHQFGFRISNTFNLEANGQIFYSEQSFLSANASGQQHCTSQMWHPGLPVNLRVVSGQEFGQFTDLNGNPLGHEVTVPGFNVDQVSFLANGTEPDSISDFVTIEASSFGITRTATIEVLRISESPIWLAMDAQGDVSYGAEMSVLAQALNMFQQEVSAGPGVTYTFQIIEASEWGTLFRGAVEGSIISGVRPTDDFFSRGMATIGFRARKAEPATPQRVTVKVSASNPEIHPGTYSFNVLPSPLAISVNPPTISYGQQSTVSVQKKNPDGTVSPWSQDAGFSYEIIKGHNAGYILHPDTSRRDDFFNGQSDTIQFVALEESPQPDTVRVQFYIYVFNEGGGIATAAFDPIQPNPALRRTGLASVTVVKGNSVDHFDVTVVPDTIAQTDSARIFVQAKDVDDNNIELPNETELAFVLDFEGATIGNLLAADGFLSNSLSGISYQEAVNGEIRFVAKSAPPPVPTIAASSATSESVANSSLIVGTALISAFLTSDAATSGTGSVVVRKKVRIRVIPQHAQLKPLGDGDNKKLDPTCTVPEGQPDTCRRIIDFSKVNPTTVTVFVTDEAENALSNYPFTVTAFVRPNSGGHDHTDQRPTGSFEVAGFDFPVVTFQGHSDPNGLATYRYFSSGFGGVDSIFVRGMTDRDTGSATILLKMGEFVELIEGAYYDLIGAFGEPGVTSEHRRNHFGTTKLRSTLTALADSIYADSSFVLRFNDMSLERGGPFDINNNWNTPHVTHRDGATVDIDDEESTGKLIARDYLWKWIQTIEPRAKLIDETNHFHATVR